MLEIIAKQQFTITPWKNGKGQTTELAISPDGTLEQFDWRLSIATVAEDGPFSNFSGYERNLILIEGNGLTLTHDLISTDRLTDILDFATFDGGSKTQGEILNGAIKDFNVMTAKGRCTAKVETFKQSTTISPEAADLVFAYSPSNEITITSAQVETRTVPAGDLVKLSQPENITLSSKQFFIIYINYL